MNGRWMLAGALALAVGPGCTQAQKPYNFKMSPLESKNAAADRLGLGLERIGLTPGERLLEKGVVFTEPTDTGRACKTKTGESGTARTRYQASGAQNGAAMLKLDVQCCTGEAAGFGVVQSVAGRCLPSNGEILVEDQQELDRLGRELQQAVSQIEAGS